MAYVETADRKIRVSEPFMDEVAAAIGCTYEWGEPDADGFYTPTFTRVVSSLIPDNEYLCLNCLTPWKCNGPHIPERSK